jgi:rhamnogalacturonan endolyase
MTRFLAKTATFLFILLISLAGLFWPGSTGNSQTPVRKPPRRQMEKLGRGVVALNEGGGKIFVSWRMLGTDPDDIAFNLYRATDDGEPVKINDAPITDSTNYVDTGVDPAKSNAYFVRPIVKGVEQPMSKPFLNKIAANAPVRQYIEVPMQTPVGYTINDCSVGDLDGDGEYEIVVHMTGRGKDNAQNGPTDPPILQAYKLDGTLLWSINLGKNIREGAHYTQFMVYDLDGDGRAEVCCKTADGTVDGKGKVIGDPKANWVGTDGRINKGPEFFTVFDGLTGAALATVDYIPPRGNLSAWGGIGGNGGNDSIGNRADRFLACVAYLDGVRPSVVMCRGYYGRSVLAAWDWRDQKLTSRWVFDTDKGYPSYAGMGAHSVSVADVDGDGKDEIIYHSMVVNSDGTGRFSTGLRHGDALHVGSFDPGLPGLQVFGIHESAGNTAKYMTPGVALYDANSGKILWKDLISVDVGRGLCADIDPRYPGEEMWCSGSGLRDCKGEKIGKAPSSTNFAIWWDGGLLRNLLDSNRIMRWDWMRQTLVTILTAIGCISNNGTKATPCLSADLFGDWREEVIWRTQDNKALRIFSTTNPTKHRLYTLMHDPQYRLAIAWQNVAYNQPPHPSFFLGDGMKAPPRPNIELIRN